MIMLTVGVVAIFIGVAAIVLDWVRFSWDTFWGVGRYRSVAPFYINSWPIIILSVGIFLAICGWLFNDYETNLNRKRQEELRQKENEEAELARQQRQKKAELELQRRQRKKVLALLQHRIEEQQGYRKQIIVLNGQTISLFESIPMHLKSAEKLLDQAEADFAEGAFAPFWDSIENVAEYLGRFDKSVRDITNNSSRYTALVKQYEDTPPAFSLTRQSVAKLGVGTATAERMQAIVRKAQRNFQFSQTYLQLRTNKILVAGFANLAEALAGMTSQITSSVDKLTSSVEGMSNQFTTSINKLAGSVGELTTKVDKGMGEITSRMDNITETINQQHREIMDEASGQAERQEKVVEMLDNIQRGRKT